MGGTQQTGPAAQLRGFGTIHETRLPARQGMRFECDSPAHATLLIHKLARDMSLSATVPSQWVTVTLNDNPAPVLVRPGLGAYLVLTQGNTAYCFTVGANAGGDAAGLEHAFAFAAAFASHAGAYDPAYTYPTYLDKWSDKGIGTWYTPYGPFDDNPKGLKDIVNPHFKYLTENNLAVHVGGKPATRETLHFIHEYNRPFHVSQWHEWDGDIARLNPYDVINPGPLFTSWSTYYSELSFGGDKLQQYRDWQFQQTMLKPFVNDPLLVDWDEPHGEIGPGAWELYWDYSENNRRHFAAWLRTIRGYTPASLGQTWHHNPARFKNWQQVPIPFDYSLFGYDPKTCLFANHTWRLHTAEVNAGLAAGYQQPGFDDTKWPTRSMPGGDSGALMVDVHKRFWYRGTFNVPVAYLRAHAASLFLAVASMNQGGGPHNPDHVWLNGVDLGGLTAAGGLFMFGSKDIRGLVHPGLNHIVYSPTSSYIPGGFYLSPQPLETYPFSETGRNARYNDWLDYVSYCAAEEEHHTLQTMRGTDPNRAIKIMAAGDRDLFNPMMADYGGFMHNTGDEAYFVPWDRRSGYVWGLPASAESSGSMVEPKYWKKWLGWYTFENLNAFDNFIDVEAMMYTPVTPLWKQYFPYLHLSNRYTMRQPQIALLDSEHNKRLTNIPYSWDLGRGDLQPLGYSYAYVDEPALQRGLANKFKILWDGGTWNMTPQTVSDIRKYVEQGGTFVALQETGRNTYNQRDAWPIESLTGFKVKQVRPMGGFVSILNDQPLFTKLAGQNFENSGRSVDYSGYNFADKCLVLEPAAPGTQAVARYRDGSIAIGMRRLGKGRAVVLGSPFWRDSYDDKGTFWPGAQQSAFLQDLLTGLDATPEVPADTINVWRDRYVADNGTEEYMVLWNPSDTAEATVKPTWRPDFPVSEVYDPKTGQTVPAQIQGNNIQLNLTLQPLETLILAAQSSRPPADTLADWYGETAKRWKSSLPGRTVNYPALPVYYQDFPTGEGKIVPTSGVTPARLAYLSSTPGAETDWDSRLSLIRPFYAGLTATDADSVIYRTVVATPASWQPSDLYILRVKKDFDLRGQVYLNGSLVADGQQVNRAGTDGIDVTPLIKLRDDNILVIAANKDGFSGSPDLWRQPKALETMPITGDWNLRADEDHAPTMVSLPGTFTGLYASKKVTIPANWRGSHVFIRIVSDNNAPVNRYLVNNKMFFYSTNAPLYMDITPWVKFGAENTLLLQSRRGMQSWEPEKVTVQSIQLERVAVRG